MDVFVKSKKDFRTIYRADAQNWNVPIATIEKDYGSITIPSGDRKDFSGDIAYFDGAVFLIEESSKEDSDIQLKVSDPVNMFSRPIFFPETPAETFGEFIEEAIENNYINCDDSEYAISYLDVINVDSGTEFVPPDIDSAGMYKLTDVIEMARERGLVFIFQIISRRLVFFIANSDPDPHNVIFSDGHADLDDESFSRTKTAKITVLKATDTSGVYDQSIWYLSKNGDISETVPEERMAGEWVYIQIGKDEDPYASAVLEFNRNLESHKIKFYSDRQYNIYDTVQFIIDDELMTSKIVSIFLSSDDSRRLYTCGDLATTLTEKVQKLS